MIPYGFPHWRTMYTLLPKDLRDAIWESAPSASPGDGIRGVPQTWALLAYWHGKDAP